jgi:L-asparaginase II
MNNLAVKRTRGSLVESKHYANIAVIDHNYNLKYYLGDPDYFTFFRSSAKPVQALQVILSGAAGHFKLSDQEIAIMCASHYGEPEHINTVLSIMRKTGLSLTDFRCGEATSINRKISLQMAKKGITGSELISDCSGKHSGMLAVCKFKNYSMSDYLDKNHPVQLENLRLISLFAETPIEDISLGIDGCSVPVFALTLKEMATAYLNLVNPSKFEENIQSACHRIFDSMNNYPFMISGTDGFCTALMKATKGRLIGKIGAEGVYCIALKNEKIAIALKIEDGLLQVVPPVAMHTLKQLNLLSNQEYYELEKFHHFDNLNNNGLTVGQVFSDFTLNEV